MPSALVPKMLEAVPEEKVFWMVLVVTVVISMPAPFVERIVESVLLMRLEPAMVFTLIAGSEEPEIELPD